jgi:hypothetical protein
MLFMRPSLDVKVGAIGQFLADVIPTGRYELDNILAIYESSRARMFGLVTNDGKEVSHEVAQE